MEKFPKSCRLRQRGMISRLFREGKVFYMHPFKVLWCSVEPQFTTHPQVLLSVSRKNFKRAVDRNRIRRLMKEAYRKNQHWLFQNDPDQQKPVILAIVYTGNAIPEFHEVMDKIMAILKRLSGDYEKSAG